MFEKYIVIGGCVFGVAVLTVAAVGVSKVNKFTKKFDKSVTDLNSITIKDIQERMVEEAVKNAADDAVSSYVARARNEVMAKAKEELTLEVKAAVGDAKVDIRQRTEDEVINQVANINIDDMKKSVREKAEARVLNKFDDNMQDILDKFSGNLSRIQKVYGSIEEALKGGVMNKNDSGKITFSLGN